MTTITITRRRTISEDVTVDVTFPIYRLEDDTSIHIVEPYTDTRVLSRIDENRTALSVTIHFTVGDGTEVRTYGIGRRVLEPDEFAEAIIEGARSVPPRDFYEALDKAWASLQPDVEAERPRLPPRSVRSYDDFEMPGRGHVFVVDGACGARVGETLTLKGQSREVLEIMAASQGAIGLLTRMLGEMVGTTTEAV